MKKQPTLLIILDGYGYSAETDYNAIYLAKKPNLDAWMQQYPHTIIQAAGRAVGLPECHMGNSEVGHLTIGSGRVIQQPITLINKAIDDGTFFNNKVIVNNLKKLSPTNTLHIMGLLSDSCVHSAINHLHALIKMAADRGVVHTVVHTFLDGRDTPPESAAQYLQALDKVMHTYKNAQLGSIHGRFYAMDRDNNWDRIKQSYDILTTEQKVASPWQEILKKNYRAGITDEFIVPTQRIPNCTIKDGDGIIFFNVRPDRARELTAAFVQPNFDKFPTKKLKLAFFVTPVSYDATLDTTVIYPTPTIKNSLKEVLSAAEKTMFSIAETEKYAHVTYFFSGGKEKSLQYETQVLIPSIKAHDYIDTPCMSADKITDAVLESLKNDPQDFYLINYANADMVGHSGNLEATIKAVECLDKQLKKLYATVITKMNGTMYVTADHGNAEQKFDEMSGQPSTAHTVNPVPFIMIKKGLDPQAMLPLNELADIAPFVLKNMDLEVPDEMKK
jgi:2,3-bisphosphoglycerate-independent phosphoglycerate mutase